MVVGLTLSTEALKLIVSLAVFYHYDYHTHTPAHWFEIVRPANSGPYAAPAFVYVLDNNLQFAVLYFLRPSEVSVGGIWGAPPAGSQTFSSSLCPSFF